MHVCVSTCTAAQCLIHLLFIYNTVTRSTVSKSTLFYFLCGGLYYRFEVECLITLYFACMLIKALTYLFVCIHVYTYTGINHFCMFKSIIL